MTPGSQWCHWVAKKEYWRKNVSLQEGDISTWWALNPLTLRLGWSGMEGEAVLCMAVTSGESRLDTDSEASVVWVAVES